MNDLTTWFESVLRGLSRAHSRGASNLAYAGGFVVAVVAISAIALVVPGNRLGEIVEYSICKVAHYGDDSACKLSNDVKEAAPANRWEKLKNKPVKNVGDSYASGEGSGKEGKDYSPDSNYNGYVLKMDGTRQMLTKTYECDINRSNCKLISEVPYNGKPVNYGFTSKGRSANGKYLYELEGFETGRNRCHRGVNAGDFLSEWLGSSYTDVSCSGAVTADLRDDSELKYTHQGAQIDLNDELNDEYGLVTMSIGGNDVNFAGILKNCATENCKDDTNGISGDDLDKILAGGKIPGTGKTLKETLVEQYIAQANATKNATIAVTGYPRFFDDVDKSYTTWVAIQKIDINPEEKKWMNAKVDAMNEIIKAAASEAQQKIDKNARSDADIVYFDLTNEFAGKGVDSSDSYINDIYGFDGSGWGGW